MVRDQDLRSKILAAARDLFIERGFSGSNIRSIAAAAGVSMGGLYHHFANKEEIYKTLLGETNILADASVVSTMIAAEEFPDNMEEIGRAICKTVEGNRDYFKLIYLDILEFQARNVKPVILAFRNAARQFAEAALDHRRDPGPDGIHPAVMVRLVLDLFFHYSLESLQLGTNLAEELGISENELVAQYSKLLLGGLRAHLASPPDRDQAE